MFGCNMLSHRDLAIGHYVGAGAESSWYGSTAMTLRERCQAGDNTACVGCDNASRTMNHVLRELGNARHHRGPEGER